MAAHEATDGAFRPGDRVRVVGAPRCVVQGREGEVVSVTVCDSGWVAVGVVLDEDDDADDPWVFDVAMLAAVGGGR